MAKIVNDLVNKAVFGGIYLGLIAVFGTITNTIFKITISGNISDLGNAIVKMSIGQAIVWFISIAIFAGVAIMMAKHKHTLMVLGRHEQQSATHISHITWYGVLGVGILSSVALWALQYLAVSMGGTIGLGQFWTSVTSGSILGVIGSLLSFMVVGYVIEGIASHITKIQEEFKKSELSNKLHI